MKYWLATLLLTALGCLTETSAREMGTERPVVSCWSVSAGGARVADTYLSPVIYRGETYGLSYSRLQAMRFNPERWSQGLEFGATFNRADNRAGNASMLGARIEASWRMLWRLRPARGWQAGTGGDVSLDAGALLLARNGNNPAQAQASITIGWQLFVRWHGKIGKLPVTASWNGSTPLTGAFFCPDFGELYYEISLGNRNGLVHAAWPGNYRRFKSRLSFDLNFGGTTLRLGYRTDLLSSRASHVTARRLEHSAVIGIVTEWLSVNPRNHTPRTDAKIISAYY